MAFFSICLNILLSFIPLMFSKVIQPYELFTFCCPTKQKKHRKALTAFATFYLLLCLCVVNNYNN